MKIFYTLFLTIIFSDFSVYSQFFGGQIKSKRISQIASLNCINSTNSGTLIAGASASGVSSSVPYTGGNGGAHNGQNVISSGVTGLTATLASGTFAVGAGSLTYTISGTPSSVGTASFALNIGGQTCTLAFTVGLPNGTITAVSCGTATNSGTLIAGTSASGISSSVPYTGGNGGTHNGQNVTSTGVTGLTASLVAGTFVVGAGSLNYTISGTPSASGTASFTLNIGGQSCILTWTVNDNLASKYPVGSVFCSSGPTEIVDVTNPITGRIWMDRNLGAIQVATSSTDASSYGDLYQWGRGSDGHQCRNSNETTIMSSSDQPGNGNFIISSVISSTIPPYGDWRSPQNNNLWQGVNGINNPCPFGYRLPTSSEFLTESNSWSPTTLVGAFKSPLKFPCAGSRYVSNATIESVGSGGMYWTSTISNIYAIRYGFGSLGKNSSTAYRGIAYSIRCIKN